MRFYEVAPNQIVRAGTDTFTYSSDKPVPRGTVVRISVGKRMMCGVIMSEVQDAPTYDVKPIDSILVPEPIPERYLNLAYWISEYYVTPLAVVLQTMLPTGLQKKRRKTTIDSSVISNKRTKYVLNDDQQSSVDEITRSGHGTSLLHGITGSGKTAVYIELARRSIDSGKSVLVLVPEIALTSQLVQEFSSFFDHVVLSHSRQTESERHSVWNDVLTHKQPQIIIGPRSALFLPARELGCIIIDECHEPSYKQEQSPRYNALRAAHFLADASSVPLVLGSATPSVTDYYIAQSTGRPIATMNALAISNAQKPTVQIVDMTKRTHFKRHRFLSDQALAKVEHDTASGKQVLMFHNRRGSAPTTLCENCRWQAGCPRCYVPLTLHADQHQLRCHICNFNDRVPTNCPECGDASIIHKGIGTKMIESEIRRLFPKLTIARFDGDTHQTETVDQRYSDLKDGTIDVIIGTQVIAKGLDLPKLGSVIVVQADAGLSLPDYGSAERTFQLLAQVIGRVGRSSADTSVVVQSYQPTHPAITLGLSQNYAEFYPLAIEQRKRSRFPPFTFLLKLQCAYKTEAAAVRNARAIAQTLTSSLGSEVEILGPTPAFYERAGGSYRWQLVVKSSNRAALQRAVTLLPASGHWQYELDPVSLL